MIPGFDLFSLSAFDIKLFSKENVKRTLLWIVWKPWWVLVIVSMITVLANTNSFPPHKSLQWLKSLFGGEWLSFMLKFKIIVPVLFCLWLSVLVPRLIYRLIINRDCCEILPLPIYFLSQLEAQDIDEPWFWREFRLLELYIYISSLYFNYLVMANSNFTELELLIGSEQFITAIALIVPPGLLAVGIFVSTIDRIKSLLFLDLSN